MYDMITRFSWRMSKHASISVVHCPIKFFGTRMSVAADEIKPDFESTLGGEILAEAAISARDVVVLPAPTHHEFPVADRLQLRAASQKLARQFLLVLALATQEDCAPVLASN